MGLVELLVIIVVGAALYRSLARRLDALENREDAPSRPRGSDRLDRLEYRLVGLERLVRRLAQSASAPTETVAHEAAEQEAAEEESVERAPPLVPLPSLQTIASNPALHETPAMRAAAPAPTRGPAPAPPVPVEPHESPLQQRWRQIERRLVENWTGILGTVVVVVGITFIGTYAGLQMSPFQRTVLVVAAAGALAGGASFLGRSANWVPLSLWLRSGAAAVFLFAMFASSAIPGLRWITSLAPALAALVAGVAVNLVVAAVAHAPVFASLHVVLSLVPLVLMPQSETSLVLATVVAVAGLGLAVRPRWDVHALITLASYIVYHLAWYVRVVDRPTSLEAVAAVSALLVGVAGALPHYRKAYAAASLEPVPFLVHVMSWALVGMAVVVHVDDARLRGGALLAGAVALFLLARRATPVGVRWVHVTDTLVAQALAMVAIVSFRPLVFHWLMVPVLLFVEAAIYLRVVIDEDEPALVRSGVVILHVSALVTFLTGLGAGSGATRALRDQNALVLLAAAAFGVGVHVYLLRKRDETFDSRVSYGETEPGALGRVSLLGICVGLITLAALVNLSGGRWTAVAAAVAGAGFVVLSGPARSQALVVAAWMTLTPAFLISWTRLLGDHPVPLRDQLLFDLAPLAAAAAVAIARAPAGSIGVFLRRTTVYLLGIHAGVAAYTLLQPLSPLIPGIAWLSLSLVALELANRLRGDALAPVLHIGYGYLVAFTGAYVLVVLQTQAYVGPVPVRLLIEAFAIAVAAFWWRYRPRGPLAELRSWMAVHPLWLEVLVGLVAVVIVVEVAPQWRPIAWGALALAGIAPLLGGKLDTRLRFYSLASFWGSTVDLVLVTSLFAAPSPEWYEHPGLTGAAALGVQIAYLIVGPGRLALTEIAFPPFLEGFARWSRTVAARQPLWVFYPFFIGGAVFLYWRFAAAVLTLLWAGEAFVVFVLSLVLRENHFRYMALAALAACLVRLLLFDMSQANLALRGIVFLGVGALMLAMNALYNRYKERFA